MPLTHPNAKTVWTTLEMDPGGKISTVLVVETDLRLSADDPHYDREKVSGLVSVVGEYFDDNQRVLDRVRIVPLRPNDKKPRHVWPPPLFDWVLGRYAVGGSRRNRIERAPPLLLGAS
jgi:hypothetical protein